MIRKLQINHKLFYAWSEPYPMKNTKISTDQRSRHIHDNMTEMNNATSVISTNQLDNNINQHHNTTNNERKVVIKTYTSRDKGTLINCFIKLLTIPIFVTFFAHLFEVADIKQFALSGFEYFTFDKRLVGMFCVHIVVSFVGYHFAWVGCMVTLQRLCFAIPLTFATPICIVIVLTQSCEMFGLDKCDVHLYSTHGTVVTLLSIVLWLGQFFAISHYIWKSQEIVMAGEATLFWVPSYDGKKFCFCCVQQGVYPLFYNENSLLIRKARRTVAKV